MVIIEEVIIVEGKYDKNTLSQVVDAVILETSGFGIFHDKERRKLFQKLAEQRGLIILTDSDGAGFVIRNYLKGILPPEKLKQAYVPDLYGKEKRKASPSKEGKLGVEGMRPEILLEALRRGAGERGLCTDHQGRSLLPGTQRRRGQQAEASHAAQAAGSSGTSQQ